MRLLFILFIALSLIGASHAVRADEVHTVPIQVTTTNTVTGETTTTTQSVTTSASSQPLTETKPAEAKEAPKAEPEAKAAPPASSPQPEKKTEPEKGKTPAEKPKVTVTETQSSSPSPAPAQQRPDPKATRISMSFDKADINSVVKFLSSASGVPIVCDPSLNGNISIVSLKQIPLCDAYEVVNSALRVRGFAMVGDLQSKVIRVSPLKKAVADRSVVQSGKEPDAIESVDNLVTQVIPLSFISALKLKDDLKDLVAADQASIVAITATNTLIITDNGGNVHRVAEIIEALDKDTSDVIEVKVYRCQHSSADSLVDTLTKIFQIKPAGGQPQPGRPPQEGGQPPQVKADDGLVSLKGEIRIASDVRTNQLIISTSKEKLKLVMDVIGQLDVDTDPEVKAETFELKYADAKMVAEQLNRLFEQPQGSGDGGNRRSYYSFYDYYGGGSQGSKTTDYAGLKRNIIVADVRTNSVIVTATEQNMKAFREMIDKLDAPKVLSEVTRVFPLKYAKADDLATTLNNLFRGQYRRPNSFFDFFYYGSSNQNNEGGPIAELKNITVVAEEKTNTLLITGPPQSFTMVENLITQLDRRTAQVYIEVAIIDVTLDKDTQFGVEWTWTSSARRPDGTPEQTASTDFGLARLPLGFKYSVVSDNLRALLRALETKSNVKVYSTPTISTADNVEALISIGTQIAVPTSEYETASGQFVRNFIYKDVAVALNVTPHVNGASDVIAMDLRQTIDEITGRDAELDTPIIASREVVTSISVKDGQTVVIGGIMKENKELISKGIPIISRIPLIGNLFASREWRNTKSELMVFLTPHVLKDDADAAQITDQAMDNLTYPPKGMEKTEKK